PCEAAARAARRRRPSLRPRESAEAHIESAAERARQSARRHRQQTSRPDKKRPASSDASLKPPSDFETFQFASSGPPTLPVSFAGLIRKRARAGSSHIAPTMFQRNMKVSIKPMSAWNLIAEKTQVKTPIARQIPVKMTALPVDLRVW